MTAERVSRSSRRFAAVGLCWLVCWQVTVLVSPSRRLAVLLGVLGFVLHVAFGKAYALVPTYFDRSLAVEAAPDLQLGLSTAGVAVLAVGTVLSVPLLAAAGALAWTAGVSVFLGTLVWTVRGNLTGSETATGEANAHRRSLDRVGNAVVPITWLYLAVGSYELLTTQLPVPSLVGRGWFGVAHLFAAGCAALLLFGVGARLLPRFTATTPPRRLLTLVLVTGALGPALLVWGGPGGPVFVLGALTEATAVVGFALSYALLLASTDRDRVGLVGVAAGVVSGVCGIALGVGFATGLVRPTLPAVFAHLRLNVLGFLGLSVIGVLYQFYPPAAGTFPWNDDRVALGTLAALAGGLWIEAGGVLLALDALVLAGRLLGVAGSVGALAIVAGVFRFRAERQAG